MTSGVGRRRTIRAHAPGIKATACRRCLPLLCHKWAVVAGRMWLEGYVPDQYVNALQVSGQLGHGRGGRSGPQMDSVLNDSLLIFGGLVILLGPMALALTVTGPGGTGWKF